MKFSVTTTDPSEIALLTNAQKYFSALWDIKEYLRQKTKYSEDRNTNWEDVREEIMNLMDGINFDEVA